MAAVLLLNSSRQVTTIAGSATAVSMLFRVIGVADLGGVFLDLVAIIELRSMNQDH